MNPGVPLAWLQLTMEKRRLLAAVAGIVFAVVLMLVQLGFEDALLSSAGLLHSRLRADLVLINPQYQFIISPKSFTERRLYQALGLEEVQSVASVYLGQAPFKNPENRQERVIFLIAFDPRSSPLDLPGVDEQLPLIRQPEVVLMDSISRPEFGPVRELFAERGRVITEAGGRRIQIAGFYPMGTSFGVDGSLITSDVNFQRIQPHRRLGVVDMGLIRLKPGAEPERVKAKLEALLPADVRVLTHRGFVELERHYWTSNTPIGFVFKLGTLMGLVVGSIIVYQILYSDVADHLGEYATLKALGFPDRYLFRVVLQESLILSVLGFLPGVALSSLVYLFAGQATLLPLRMTWGRAAVVFLLTAVMCAGSGALAMRKLKTADPAEIF
jgi:putative ABC transport system permease protein